MAPLIKTDASVVAVSHLNESKKDVDKELCGLWEILYSVDYIQMVTDLQWCWLIGNDGHWLTISMVDLQWWWLICIGGVWFALMATDLQWWWLICKDDDWFAMMLLICNDGH